MAQEAADQEPTANGAAPEDPDASVKVARYLGRRYARFRNQYRAFQKQQERRRQEQAANPQPRAGAATAPRTRTFKQPGMMTWAPVGLLASAVIAILTTLLVMAVATSFMHYSSMMGKVMVGGVFAISLALSLLWLSRDRRFVATALQAWLVVKVIIVLAGLLGLSVAGRDVWMMLQ